MSSEKGTSSAAPAWSKAVLVIFWIFQTIFMLIALGSSAAALAVAKTSYTTINGNGNTTSVSSSNTSPIYIAVCAVVLVISSLSIIFNITEMILYGRSRLTAPAYFGLQITKFLLWSLIFIMALARIRYNGIVWIMSQCVVEALFLATFIYAIVQLHRHRIAKRNAAYTHSGAPQFSAPTYAAPSYNGYANV